MSFMRSFSSIYDPDAGTMLKNLFLEDGLAMLAADFNFTRFASDLPEICEGVANELREYLDAEGAYAPFCIYIDYADHGGILLSLELSDYLPDRHIIVDSRYVDDPYQAADPEELLHVVNDFLNLDTY